MWNYWISLDFVRYELFALSEPLDDCPFGSIQKNIYCRKERRGMRAFRVFGMKRSGNHAIISWLIKNSGVEKYDFLNNCKKNSVPYKGAFSIFTEEGLRVSSAEGDGKQRDIDLILASYEDPDLPRQLGGTKGPKLQWPHPSPIDIVIERDFVNWLPSYVKLWQNRLKEDISVILSRSFQGIAFWKRNHLYCSDNREIQLIRYGIWCQSLEYRKKILADFGLEFLSDDISGVPTAGGGSSFDGLAYDGKSQEMAVGERWRHIPNDPLAASIFRVAMLDRELKAIVAEQSGHELATLEAKLY